MIGGAAHWNEVYETKRPDAVSWYAPHLDLSLEIVTTIASNRRISIVDVGGGASTFPDDLLTAGYSRVAVLDIARTAVAAAKRRLGDRARRIDWYVADVTRHDFGCRHFDLWHDRAVFHFLTDPADRAAYVACAGRTVRPGGHLVIAGFGPEGPRRCSGLDVMRHDPSSLGAAFRADFELMDARIVEHVTPTASVQQFLYGVFRRRPTATC